MSNQQTEFMQTGKGFIAALDQSGGSTPKALKLYGISESEYSGESQMYDKIHEMRTRIITSPSFSSDRVLAAILFEQTMERTIAGLPTGDYLWERKAVVPFVKVDQGLAEAADGVQLMKPLTGLDALLDRAVEHRMFGTKMRSLVREPAPAGIRAVVDQQFDVGRRIAERDLVPILEPEVSIDAPDKADAEELLKAELLAGLERWPAERPLMFKLTIPSVDGFYSDLMAHPKVLRVVALSGGYSRDEADERLARNPGLIASFSRALVEGLTAQQDDAAFDAALAASVDAIYRASIT